MTRRPRRPGRGQQHRRHIRRLAIPAALTLLLPLTACSGSDASGGTTLTVYAAASLTTTFERLAKDFEAEHDGVDVRLSFGGSSDLVTQVQNGAGADVLASADSANMQKLVDDHLTAGDPQVFATNTLEIAVPPGNPAGVRTFADLAKPGVDVVVCAPQVPCGAAAQQVEQRTGVTLHPVSEEQSVTDVLGKVTSGEADAGLVYVTDVRAAGKEVEGVPFPEARSVVNDYPIATIAGTGEQRLADEFVALVTGPTGQRVLRGAGFGAP